MVGYQLLVLPLFQKPSLNQMKRIYASFLRNIPFKIFQWIFLLCVIPNKFMFIQILYLRSFPKGSAPGPSGTRASHLLHAIQINNQTPALDVLTDFVNHLSAGLVPLEVQPFLAEVHLIGLSKKDGGIGDVYRRLTGKCLFSSILSDANTYFLPSQCVCAVGGGEAVVHACRQIMEEFASNFGKCEKTSVSSYLVDM